MEDDLEAIADGELCCLLFLDRKWDGCVGVAIDGAARYAFMGGGGMDVRRHGFFSQQDIPNRSTPVPVNRTGLTDYR